MTDKIRATARIGPISAASGNDEDFRSDGTGAIVMTQGHGRFAEAARRSRIFSLDSDSVTLAAAHTTKGALGTVKLIVGFFNPPGSGFNAEILRSHVATVSGTPAGPYFYNFLAAAVIDSATTGTVRSTNLGNNSAGNTVVVPQVNVVLTQAALTTALKQLGVQGGPAAIAAGAGVYDSLDEPDGSIIVPPGTLFGICALGAGTSHVVQSTLVWEEVPVITGI